ncbi:hypothetical protein PI124_g18657 [Phytophthora idaei]|nr:hypothetical protein PI125_g19487 [Phytophthora idaei]KAG3136076.1 hypothetical protein PI126_g17979 [Phytophthora idaei]KAG3236329.1 hypothetical protein PI124_g18657 [Phytophthora idaei]
MTIHRRISQVVATPDKLFERSHSTIGLLTAKTDIVCNASTLDNLGVGLPVSDYVPFSPEPGCMHTLSSVNNGSKPLRQPGTARTGGAGIPDSQNDIKYFVVGRQDEVEPLLYAAASFAEFVAGSSQLALSNSTQQHTV